MNPTEPENIAATVHRLLPQPVQVLQIAPAGGGSVTHFAVPANYALKSVDDEHLLDNPRRTVAAATFADARSFIDYVTFHDSAGTDPTTVWCAFDPVRNSLSFEAVFDEHAPTLAGWRKHRAIFTPTLSQEWKTWGAHNTKEMGQIVFAEFLENNEKDIVGDGVKFPTSIEMMGMAVAFEANADKKFKSRVRLQSGGVNLEYVNTDDEATIERMKLFERFQIGVPVFWEIRHPDAQVPAWPVEARLKYRVQQGILHFWYSLIRPDIIHERAALAMIERIREGLGDIPLRMGSCT